METQLIALCPRFPPEPGLWLENQPIGSDIYSLVISLIYLCHESRDYGPLPYDKCDMF